MCLDSDFNPVNTIFFLNLQWNRRYYECGQFSLQMLAKDYNESFAYVYRNDMNEIGIVQKSEYTSKINGDFMQLSGFFLERKLNDEIIFPTFNFNGNIEVGARKIVTDYCKNTLKLTLGELVGLGSKIQLQETGEQVSTRLYAMLQTQELSYKLDYNYTENKIYFSVWQGLDRTQNQNTNEFVVFSESWGNMQDIALTNDHSNFKNYAVVAGEGEGEARVHVIVDISNGAPLKKIYIDARDLQKEDGNTDYEYKELLRQRGLEKLLDYADISNVDFKAVDKTTYLKDYDLGDKCDIVISDLGVSYQSRIIGIDETIKENKQEINLIMGDKIPTIYTKRMIGGM